jgi:hypothetical protein
MAPRQVTEISSSSKKRCFVICPIGENGSEERKWSDDLLECIISPVIEKMGYLPPIRADQITESGIITRQIVDLLIESDLVIADLSYRNPNVCYELAVRHVVKKPFIHMIKNGHKVPFDTASNRTIPVDLDIRSAKKAMLDLEKHILTIKDGINEMDNPIGNALTLRDLKGSGDPSQIISVELMEAIQEIASNVRILRDEKKLISFAYNDASGNIDINSSTSNLPLRELITPYQKILVNQYIEQLKKISDLKKHNPSKKELDQNENELYKIRKMLIELGTHRIMIKNLDRMRIQMEDYSAKV